ncbi:MAG: hypothetical protein IKV57_07210 [Clostridia bacterium]|nr:hypothetical protein [Clostridia bacterium]
MAETGIVNRSDRRHFMNTGTADAPVWSLIGEGFTEFMESKNAVSYQRRYIHESVKRTDVTGYAPTVDYEFEVYSGNPVIDRLRRITDEEMTGSGAWVQICTADLFDEAGSAGVCKATVRTWSVIPDECGEGTDTLLYTGTMKAISAPVQGTFVVSTGTFTAG